MIEAIFWDNDGILVETEPVYFQATRHVLKTVGVDLTEADYIQLFLVEGTGAWHLAEQQGIDRAGVEALRNQRNALYSEWLAQAPRLIDGITPVLEQLRGRYVMGIVTSSRRDHFDVIHRTTGLLGYFDFVLTADDFNRVKPDPEPYLRAIAKSGIAPAACLAIEDSERGLKAALGAGISCVVVPTALTRGGTFAGACRILESVSQIPALLSTSPPPHHRTV
ncbi:MAG: HAD family phosphatase [Acidobacteriota bacterium]